MNTNLDFLFKKAREEKIPKIDVTDNIMAIINANERESELYRDKPLMWIAALSSATAVSCIVMAFLLSNFWIGPLFEISQAISWVL